MLLIILSKCLSPVFEVLCVCVFLGREKRELSGLKAKVKKGSFSVNLETFTLSAHLCFTTFVRLFLGNP